MKAYCCFSGGKESIQSLHIAQQHGIEIVCLLNMISDDGLHSRTHGIDHSCLRAQAESIGIPLVQRATTWNGYEAAFKEVVAEIKQTYGVTTGIYGDIDLQPHRDWVERVSGECGIEPMLPLWGRSREELLQQFSNEGFETVICSVNTDMMPSKFLGKTLSVETINEMRALKTVDLCGERGEYHTFVYDGPVFARPLKYTTGDIYHHGDHGFIPITVLRGTP